MKRCIVTISVEAKIFLTRAIKESSGIFSHCLVGTFAFSLVGVLCFLQVEVFANSRNNLFLIQDARKLELSDKQAKMLKLFKSDPTTVDVQVVKVKLDLLETLEQLNFNISPDQSVLLRKTRIEQRSPKDYSWFGENPETVTIYINMQLALRTRRPDADQIRTSC